MEHTVNIFGSGASTWDDLKRIPFGTRILSDKDIEMIRKKFLVVGSLYSETGFKELTVWKKHAPKLLEYGHSPGVTQSTLMMFA